jgi:hypothetical protein
MSFTLLTIVFLLITLLLLFIKDGKLNVKKSQNSIKGGFVSNSLAYILVMVFAILLAFSLKSYLSPDIGVFSNAKYHILKLKGIKKSESFYLVNDTASHKSLWEGQKGILKLNTDVSNDKLILSFERVHEPIYVNKGGKYVLENEPFDFPADGLIKFEIKDSISFEMKIQQEKNKTLYSFKFPESNGAFVQSGFQVKLKEGYDLANIILKTKDDQNIKKYAELFRGTLLLRKQIGEDNSKLHIFPGKELSSTLGRIYFGDIVLDWDEDMLSHEFQLSSSQKVLYGFGDNRKKAFYPERKEGGIYLKYSFPEQYPLYDAESGLQECMITTKQYDLIQNEGDKGFLFGDLKSPENINHVTGGISYIVDEPNVEMQFSIVDLNDTEQEQAHVYPANKEFVLNGMHGQELTYHFEVDNLMHSNLLTDRHIFNFLLLLVTLIFLSILLTKDGNLSKVELSIYLFLMLLLGIRSFLLWRSSVFMPFSEGISGTMYSLLLGSSGWYPGKVIFTPLFGTNNYFAFRTLSPMLLFFVVIYAFKIKISWNKRRKKVQIPKNEIVQNFIGKSKRNKILALYIVPFLLYFGVLLILEGFFQQNFTAKRFLTLLYPLALYFLFDYQFEKHGQNFRGVSISKVLNWGMAFIFFMVSDMGFAYIFVNFTLLWILFKRVSYLKTDKPKIKAIWLYLTGLVFLAAIFAFVFFSPYFLVFLLEKEKISSVLVIVFIFLGFFVSSYFFIRNKKKWFSGILALVFLGIGIFSLVKVEVIQQTIREHSYIKYRAELLIRDADKIMADEEFGNNGITKLLQSAENQWFISYFYKKGKGLNFDNLYTLEPHFKQGVSYIAQTTDLVTARYLIGEHSEFLVIVLLIGFFMIFYLAYQEYSEFFVLNEIALKMLFLLVSISLFIWMTSTNRFIFFGQDFPMLSMQSLFFSCYYYFDFCFRNNCCCQTEKFIWTDKSQKRFFR